MTRLAVKRPHGNSADLMAHVGTLSEYAYKHKTVCCVWATKNSPMSGHAGYSLPSKTWRTMSMLDPSARSVMGGPKTPGGLITTKPHLQGGGKGRV